MDDRVCGPSWTGPNCFFYMASSAAGLRVAESGVDCCVIGVVTIVLAIVYVASGLAIMISGFRSARFGCIAIATG